MSKLDRAIEALAALPEPRREEIAEVILGLAEAARLSSGHSVLSDDQLAEVRRRHDGFVVGDASRIDSLLARLA